MMIIAAYIKTQYYSRYIAVGYIFYRKIIFTFDTMHIIKGTHFVIMFVALGAARTETEARNLLKRRLVTLFGD